MALEEPSTVSIYQYTCLQSSHNVRGAVSIRLVPRLSESHWSIDVKSLFVGLPLHGLSHPDQKPCPSHQCHDTTKSVRHTLAQGQSFFTVDDGLNCLYSSLLVFTISCVFMSMFGYSWSITNPCCVRHPTANLCRPSNYLITREKLLWSCNPFWLM